MGEIRRAGQTGKKLFEKMLREFPGSLSASWVVGDGGTYDEFLGRFVGAVERNETLSIAAVVEDKGIEFKYAKYGVEARSDLVAMVSMDFTLPPTDAIYQRAGDPRKYVLKEVYGGGHYGTDQNGNQLFAYRILHLRAN